MVTAYLADLRHTFYGGGTDAEYNFLLTANAAGLTATSTLEPRRPYRPTGVYETIPRTDDMAAQGFMVTTGRLNLWSIWLPVVLPITKITFFTGGAAGTPLNQWFALYNSSLALLRQTADDTTTAWAANTKKQLTLTSSFTTTYTGLHYVGLMVKASTSPTLIGTSQPVHIVDDLPRMSLMADSSLTTTAPATATYAATGFITPYAYVSWRDELNRN